MDFEQVKALDAEHVIGTYSRVPIVLVKGKGARVWDSEGREYLDFLGGLAVCGLGHCHPKVVEAVQKQVAELIHCTNIYYIAPQARLAALLAELTGGMKSFFANSGTEANEGAIKLARKYSKNKHGEYKYEIITCTNSFHGRTLAALAATGQTKHHRGFEPMPEGFVQVPYGDVPAVAEAIGEKTCAVMVEPIQGEGGVNLPPAGYLSGLRQLCDEKGLVLILDEIQTGIGRTGRMFAYEHSGVKPDILTLAKALGGGIPIGAFLATPEVAGAFGPGSHGSTFGGNPVATAAALANLQAIVDEGAVENAARVGAYFRSQLQGLASRFDFVREVRGQGLMVGIELSIEGKDMVEACRRKGLLINCTAEKVLRFLPPLNISTEDVDEAVAVLREVFEEVKATQAATG